MLTSRPVLWKPWRPVLEQRIHLNNWTRDAHVPALPACACSLFACTSNFSNSLANTGCFSNLQLEGSPFAMALWAAWKAPEKLSACSQECLEGKIKKQLFGAWKVAFFSNLQLEGSPFAMALWAAGKAPEKLSACSQDCLEGKIKKQLFGAWKVVFFWFAIGRVSLCNGALGSWKSTWKA